MEVYQPQPDHAGLQAVPAESQKASVPEALPRHEEEKQPYTTSHEKFSPLYQSDDGSYGGKIPLPAAAGQAAPNAAKKKKKKRLVLFVALAIAIVLVLGLALGIPLGLRYGIKPSMTPGGPATAAPQSTPSPTSTAPSPFSTRGAFNGTAIKIVDTLGNGDVSIFSQYYNGEIRQSFTKSQKWFGGQAQDIVASADDVRNATPISASSFYENYNLTFHVTWVDKSNMIRDVVQYNRSGSWFPGTLSKKNIKVSSASHVALELCLDLDWNKGLTPDLQVAPTGGERLYYGGVDNRVHELSRFGGSGDWNETHVFDASLNANAGLWCYPRDNFAFLYGSTKEGRLGMWWQDNDLNRTNTTSYPTTTWVQGPIASIIPAANTSVGFWDGAGVFVQDNSSRVVGLQPSYDPDNLQWGQAFQVPTGNGVPGTRVAAYVVPGADTRSATIAAYFQHQGDAITESQLDKSVGKWSTDDLPLQ